MWSLGCLIYELTSLRVAFPHPFVDQSVESLDMSESTRFVSILER
jgi:hypothetical protein